MMTFAQKVKFVRAKKQLSQIELASAIGVSYSTVSRWEREDRTPQMKSVGRLIAYCEKNGIDIIGDESGSFASGEKHGKGLGD